MWIRILLHMWSKMETRSHLQPGWFGRQWMRLGWKLGGSFHFSNEIATQIRLDNHLLCILVRNFVCSRPLQCFHFHVLDFAHICGRSGGVHILTRRKTFVGDYTALTNLSDFDDILPSCRHQDFFAEIWRIVSFYIGWLSIHCKNMKIRRFQ